MQNIIIISQTNKISALELTKVVKAIQFQITNHLAPFWALDANLIISDKPKAGDWIAIIKDEISEPLIDGWHTVKNGVPFAEIRFTNDWSYSLSHELIEMLANPYIQETDQNDNVFVMQEIADATNKLGYEIDGVKVSNFVTPDYYNAIDGNFLDYVLGKVGFKTETQPLKYDYMGVLKRPLEIYEGGFMSWFDENNQYFQAVKAKGRLIVRKINGEVVATSSQQNPIYWLLIAVNAVILFLLFKRFVR